VRGVRISIDRRVAEPRVVVCAKGNGGFITHYNGEAVSSPRIENRKPVRSEPWKAPERWGGKKERTLNYGVNPARTQKMRMYLSTRRIDLNGLVRPGTKNSGSSYLLRLWRGLG